MRRLNACTAAGASDKRCLHVLEGFLFHEALHLDLDGDVQLKLNFNCAVVLFVCILCYITLAI